MKEYLNKKFESSIIKTPEFKQFARDYKKALKNTLPDNLRIAKYSIGHFYISGFITDEIKYVYFSCSDVRFFNNDWYNNILIRTAKNEKDFTGGLNNHTTLSEFGNAVKRLMQ